MRSGSVLGVKSWGSLLRAPGGFAVVMGSAPEVLGSFPRGEEPGAACSEQSQAGWGSAAAPDQGSDEEDTAVIRNDSAGVTTGGCPSGVRADSPAAGGGSAGCAGRGRGCIPPRDLLHNPGNIPGTGAAAECSHCTLLPFPSLPPATGIGGASGGAVQARGCCGLCAVPCLLVPSKQFGGSKVL